MTDQPKIACVGAGAWGKNVVRNFAGLEALSWICEADPARQTQLRAEYPGVQVTGNVNDALQDPATSGIAIATPAETHGSLVRQALLAGKHVLVEKPLCLSISEGKDLVSLAEKNKLTLMVGHLLWYHPAILKLQEMIEHGELGRIQYIYSNRLNLGKIRREENILWSFAPHDVSVILGLVGEMPESVHAQGGCYLHDRIADVTVSQLAFPSGVKAHIFVSWLHPFKEQKLIVVGDRGMAVFDDLEARNKLQVYSHSIDWKNHIPVPHKAEARPVACESYEPLRAECQHFIDCIATGRNPRTDGNEALRVLTVLQQCQHALDQKAPAAAAPASPAREAAPKYSVHPSAFIDDNVEIGEGTTIWHVSHVLKNTTIGKNCRIGQNVVMGPSVRVGNNVKIQNNVSVYEGVTLEDNVFCGPSMVFTNVINPRSEIRRMDELRSTLVRQGASLGANCTIVCGVTIGRYAFVGAGAVVVRDVPDFALVVGNPARTIGWMCTCGNRIDFDDSGEAGQCGECSRRYQKSGGTVSPSDDGGAGESRIAVPN